MFVGVTTTYADGSGAGTAALPAGANVGDLLIFLNPEGGAVPTGGGSGSFTAVGSQGLYYKVLASLSAVTFTGGSVPGSPYMVAVYRGPTSVAHEAGGSPTSDGSGVTSVTGVTKSTTCKALLVCLVSSTVADGRSSYVLSSPAGNFRARADNGGVAPTMGLMDCLAPNNYTSGSAFSVTGCGASKLYSNSFSMDLI